MIRVRSITVRLALHFAIASTLVFVSAGYVVGRLVEQHMSAQDLAALDGKLELVRSVLAKDTRAGAFPSARAVLDGALVGHHDLFVALVDADGGIVYSTPGFEVAPQWIETAIAAAANEQVLDVDAHRPDSRYHAIAASTTPQGARASDSTWPVAAIVALDTGVHRRFMAEFRTRLWASIAAGILVAAALGWAAARRGLAPARRVLGLTRRVSADRLGERLPPESVPPELADLAVAFNEMLDRLEASFRRLRDFSSDLAHEFRTPIANLMTQTQVALSKPRSANEYREILYSNLEEFERLAHMTSDMLFLAKAENGLIETRKRRVDLAAEMRQLFAFYEALCEERGIRLALVGTGRANADRDLLRRAISNLLSNAIRHARQGDEIRVAIAPNEHAQLEVAVENPGAPIAPEHLQRLFDRFYRVDASRSNEGEGAGLGLAITKSIVEAHGGSIHATSRDGIVRFAFTVPAA